MQRNLAQSDAWVWCMIDTTWGKKKNLKGKKKEKQDLFLLFVQELLYQWFLGDHTTVSGGLLMISRNQNNNNYNFITLLEVPYFIHILQKIKKNSNMQIKIH